MKTESPTLADHLSSLGVEEGLSSILLDIAKVEKRIYDSIDLCDTQKTGAVNATGDTQSSLDTSSEKMIAEALDGNAHVCSHLSEECVELRTCKANGTYFVSYDPYDGGSVGDADVTVGSIFGIWDTPPAIGGAVGKGLVCGAYVLWGPRLALAFGTIEHGVFWYEHDGTEFRLIGPLDFDTAKLHKGIFCPGDSPVLLEDAMYEELFRFALRSKFRLRYTGCCMTDTHHMLHKKGLFWYPAGAKGGLRLMYECAPLGFMIIAAGGTAINDVGANILDIPITDWHQRSSLLFASPGYEEEAEKLFIQVGKS